MSGDEEGGTTTQIAIEDTYFTTRDVSIISFTEVDCCEDIVSFYKIEKSFNHHYYHALQLGIPAVYATCWYCLQPCTSYASICLATPCSHENAQLNCMCILTNDIFRLCNRQLDLRQYQFIVCDR